MNKHAKNHDQNIKDVNGTIVCLSENHKNALLHIFESMKKSKHIEDLHMQLRKSSEGKSDIFIHFSAKNELSDQINNIKEKYLKKISDTKINLKKCWFSNTRKILTEEILNLQKSHNTVVELEDKLKL